MSCDYCETTAAALVQLHAVKQLKQGNGEHSSLHHIDSVAFIRLKIIVMVVDQKTVLMSEQLTSAKQTLTIVRSVKLTHLLLCMCA